MLDGDSKINDVVHDAALAAIDPSSTGIDALAIDFVGERVFSGEYEFPALLDLGGKFELDLKRIIKSRGLYPSDLIDDRSELVDSWSDWDGTLAEDTSAEIYFRASDEAPAADDIMLEASPDFFLLEDDSKLLQESSTTLESGYG